MTKRIMIFDDDETILTILKYILEADGWQVFKSANSNNIINQVNSVRPAVIMMDNNIPDCGGVIAIRNLKQHIELQRIPIIFFTANPDIEDLSKQAGADAWLAKPFNLVELHAIVRQVLNKSGISD